jgi:hypothetical protein
VLARRIRVRAAGTPDRGTTLEFPLFGHYIFIYENQVSTMST